MIHNGIITCLRADRGAFTQDNLDSFMKHDNYDM